MSEENKVNLPSFYAQKSGMTRIFDEAGNHVPVTVVKLIPNVISQVKTNEKDGYEAYQLAFGEKREKLVTKPVKGQLAKAGVDKFLTKLESEDFIANLDKKLNTIKYSQSELSNDKDNTMILVENFIMKEKQKTIAEFLDIKNMSIGDLRKLKESQLKI